MEKNKQKSKPNGGRGGARIGAGRPKGGTNNITVAYLLEALETKKPGAKYEDILMEDFLEARNNNDKQLVLKYHNLILNKVMTTTTKIEVTDSEDAIVAKQLAFADALAKLTGLQKE